MLATSLDFTPAMIGQLWDDLITYEMLWSLVRCSDHEDMFPKVLLSLFYVLFLIFLKMSVCVEVITLDCSHNHFFKYLSLGVSLFRLKIGFHQAFCWFFWYFQDFFWTLLMFLVFWWLFWKTIHLFASYSILKNMAAVY